MARLALVATNQKCPSHQPFMSTLPDPPWAQRKIPVDITHRIFGCSSTAIKTAFFLAEILFGYTLAMKSALFLAECSTKQAEQPLDLAAASALRSWLAFASAGALHSYSLRFTAFNTP